MGIFELLISYMLDINVKEIWVSDVRGGVECGSGEGRVAGSLVDMFFWFMSNEEFLGWFGEVNYDYAWFHV